MKLRYSNYTILFFIFSHHLLVSQPISAEMFIHKLQYTSAEKVIPMMTPHLNSNTKITFKNKQLLIHSTKEEYQKIQQILTMLDKKLDEFLVEIRVINRRLDQWEVKKTADLNNHQIPVKKFRSRDNPNEKRFRLNVIEGQQSFISTGESFQTQQPVQQYNHFLPKSRYTKISNGFYIVVNSMPDNRVMLTVATQTQQKQDQRGKVIQQATSNNQFSGFKNEWLLINSINVNNENEKNTHTKNYTSSSNRQNKHWFYVRVSDK